MMSGWSFCYITFWPLTKVAWIRSTMSAHEIVCFHNVRQDGFVWVLQFLLHSNTIETP